MKNFKKIILAAVALLLTAPSYAVFNERDLKQTLSVLRYELSKAYSEMAARQIGFEQQDQRQHEQLVHLIQDCNELSLMLYSQKQDFTFDLTYALQQVSNKYHNFTQSRLPYDNIISFFEVEIERYDRLVNTLKILPPELTEVPDSLGPNLLDSLAQTLQMDTFGGQTLPGASFADEHEDDPDHAGHKHKHMGAPDSHEDEHDHDHDHGTFELDENSQVDRDSCLFYAEKLLKMYTDLRDHMVEDNEYYETTDKRLKEAYDYAQERYKLVQKKIFIDGQRNYWTVLKNFSRSMTSVRQDFDDKYGHAYYHNVRSEWKGPMVIGFSFIMLIYLILAIMVSNIVVRLLKRKIRLFKSEGFKKRELAIILHVSVVFFVIAILVARLMLPNTHFFLMASTLLIEFSLLLIAILTSLLIRHDGDEINHGLLLYTPVMTMGLLVIGFRIIFIPNSLITLIFPPILLFFAIWQYISLKRHGHKVPKTDKAFAIASEVVTVATLVIALVGYDLLGLQVYIWWIFQLTVLQLIIAVNDILKKYRTKKVAKLIRAYKMNHHTDVGKGRGAYIMVTWLHDFVDMALIPLLVVLSIPLCIYMASQVFDLTEVCMKLFFYPFLNYEYLHLSVYKITMIVGLYFVFKYLCYALRAFYRIYRLRKAYAAAGTHLIRENEVNLTLANNVIGIIIWGIYIIIAISLLNIPTTSLSVITAGLAAGLGFAMKDILNNFFYGIQLMGGRLRVGDTVECDGIRGTVDNINYQTTQITAIDGSLIAFPNSTLFAKTFKNLTRNDSYEYIALPVGVAYGTDVEAARKIISKALAPLCKPDKFGRQMVKESYGIKVILNDFGDSSVNLLVKQYVLVEQRYTYIAKANEAIYKALNANGIEIPFPQCDVHFDPKDSE